MEVLEVGSFSMVLRRGLPVTVLISAWAVLLPSCSTPSIAKASSWTQRRMMPLISPRSRHRHQAVGECGAADGDGPVVGRCYWSFTLWPGRGWAAGGRPTTNLCGWEAVSCSFADLRSTPCMKSETETEFAGLHPTATVKPDKDGPARARASIC